MVSAIILLSVIWCCLHAVCSLTTTSDLGSLLIFSVTSGTVFSSWWRTAHIHIYPLSEFTFDIDSRFNSCQSFNRLCSRRFFCKSESWSLENKFHWVDVLKGGSLSFLKPASRGHASWLICIAGIAGLDSRCLRHCGSGGAWGAPELWAKRYSGHTYSGALTFPFQFLPESSQKCWQLFPLCQIKIPFSLLKDFYLCVWKKAILVIWNNLILKLIFVNK